MKLYNSSLLQQQSPINHSCSHNCNACCISQSGCLERTRFSKNVFMVLTDVVNHTNLYAGYCCQSFRQVLDQKQFTASLKRKK